MPEGGILGIRADNVDVDEPFPLHLPTAGRYLRIQVEDSGTGMPDEVVAKAFEPFFTTKGVGEGTGLGLATSLAIVRSHGGAVQVRSAPGVGSRFDIFLPAAVHEVGVHAVIAPKAAPRGNGELVLVVDDEPDIRHSVRQALESYGYQTAVAANGSEALEYLATFPGSAALVFSDVTMPHLDGTALEAQIANLYPDLPVLLASGYASTGDADGRREFIAKPYSTADLRAAVARALGSARASGTSAL
jgi:CheY-like chemotaxis protein